MLVVVEVVLVLIVEYVIVCVQFGWLIGSFQVVQYWLGECSVLIQVLCWLFYCVVCEDDGYCGEVVIVVYDVVKWVIYEMMQFYGVFGLMFEYLLYLWMYWLCMFQIELVCVGVVVYEEGVL